MGNKCWEEGLFVNFDWQVPKFQFWKFHWLLKIHWLQNQNDDRYDDGDEKDETIVNQTWLLVPTSIMTGRHTFGSILLHTV